MKIISPKIHGIIDYIVVIFLLSSSFLFDLKGTASIIAYSLGIIHLLLTVLTDFQAGLIKLIPFKIHGLIELIVSIVLIFVPWIFGFSDDISAKYFFIGFAIAVFLTWLLTNYKNNHESIGN